MIVHAEQKDIAEVARLHMEVFPDFFLTSLGFSFLEELYSGFLSNQTGIFLVAKIDNIVVGFTAGSTDPKYFFSRLRRKRFIFFALKALPSVLKNPFPVCKKLLQAITYRGESCGVNTTSALLSSIGVSQHYRGTKLAEELLLEFEREVLKNGVQRVYLTTDASNNERANAFYQRLGYVAVRKFRQTRHRQMFCYQKQLNVTTTILD